MTGANGNDPGGKDPAGHSPEGDDPGGNGRGGANGDRGSNEGRPEEAAVQDELETIRREMADLSERMDEIRATLDQFETGDAPDEDVDPRELAERLDEYETGDPDEG